MQAVILAAGLGLRLRPFTEQHPKALIPVCGTPLILHSLGRLPKNITEIIIVTGWLGEQIQSLVENAFQGIPVRYATQDPLNGTGGSLHAAKDLLHDSFLVLNGDDLYQQSELQTLASQSTWAILATPTTRPLQAALQPDADGFVHGLVPDPSETQKFLNCGAYLTDTDFFTLPLVGIPIRDKTEYSLPHTLLQTPDAHPVALVPATGWLPVGTPEELAKAEKMMQNI